MIGYAYLGEEGKNMIVILTIMIMTLCVVALSFLTYQLGYAAAANKFSLQTDAAIEEAQKAQETAKTALNECDQYRRLIFRLTKKA